MFVRKTRFTLLTPGVPTLEQILSRRETIETKQNWCPVHEKLNRVRVCSEFVLFSSWCVSLPLSLFLWKEIQLNFLFVLHSFPSLPCPKSNPLGDERTNEQTNELSCVLGPVVVHNWAEWSENSGLYPSMFNRTTEHLASVRGRCGQRRSKQKGKRVRQSSSPPRTQSTDDAISVVCPLLCRESASSRRSSSTDRKFTLHTEDQVCFDGSLPNRSCSDDAQPQKQPPQPLADQPGANMLSPSELKLCSSLSLPATRYITLKTVLLSGSDHSYAIKQEPEAKGVLGGGGGGGNTGSSNGSVGRNSSTQIIKKYLTRAGWLAGGN